MKKQHFEKQHDSKNPGGAVNADRYLRSVAKGAADTRRSKVLSYLKTRRTPATVYQVVEATGLGKMEADRSLQRLFRDGKVNYAKGQWWIVLEERS